MRVCLCSFQAQPNCDVPVILSRTAADLIYSSICVTCPLNTNAVLYIHRSPLDDGIAAYLVCRLCFFWAIQIQLSLLHPWDAHYQYPSLCHFPDVNSPLRVARGSTVPGLKTSAAACQPQTASDEPETESLNESVFWQPTMANSPNLWNLKIEEISNLCVLGIPTITF